MKISDKYRVVSGKDFKCAACGACCRIYSLVDLHVTDLCRISERLGMSPGGFFEKYCRTIKGDGDSWTFAMDIEGGCKFRSGGKCTIYEARPDMCAFYPNSHTCFDLSGAQKKEMKAANPGCAIHRLDDATILVPDLERMVDSRIFYMAKEMYLAVYGGVFDDDGVREYHRRGLAQVKNPRIREIVHLQVMGEMIQDLPRDENTGEPILSRDDAVRIYNKMRGQDGGRSS